MRLLKPPRIGTLSMRPRIGTRVRQRGGWRLAALVVVLSCTAGCGRSAESAPTDTGEPAGITVASTAFEPGGRIPVDYTCDGSGIAPPLSWTGVPDSARSVAMVIDDPDAPGGTYTHWVVAGLPPADGAIGEGRLPAGAVQAVTSAGHTGYSPPCPPSGTHHYRFRVYALDTAAPFMAGASTADALAAIADAATAAGSLTGLYSRR